MKLSYEDKVQIYELRKARTKLQTAFKKIWCGCFWSKVHGEIN
ncbi:hypothetical protein PCS8203_00447 [Streptococcus pneumoniae PCS8203]|nr:hypothetical protein PCS8203_00447 [Streptococcus pneumoniae PCS8203]ELU60035.1 hypothetical protein PCS8106_00372 [Streptococcus pneumoniae PCS8106]